MDCSVKIQTLIRTEKRKWMLLVGLVALTHLFCQSLLLPYGNALRSLIPNENNSDLVEDSGSSKGSPSVSSAAADVDEVGASILHMQSRLVQGLNLEGVDGKESVEKDMEERKNSDLDDDGDAMDLDFDFFEDETLGNVNTEEGHTLRNNAKQELRSLSQIGEIESTDGLSLPRFAERSSNADTNKTLLDKSVAVDSTTSSPSIIKTVVEKKLGSETSTSDGADRKDYPSLENNFANKSSLLSVKKKLRCDMPPKTVTPINEMQKLLVHHRARSRAMRPRWSSERDQDILTAKFKIESAPVLKNEQELYAPLFRNVSMFKRSYELMERVLKIYVYKEGEKPIFHQPILKGLYASEGWFMKLMERNKQFIVKDPRKAHLFYMPFSSRMLEHTIYVRNSHNRTNLRQYLKVYSEKISRKYSFWNRTGGADHFLVACHDWAPYETRHHMEHCIKALCNADVTLGFKIGRDVSLPETYIRSAKNPQRDLGGKPPSQRQILAFYAGNMHGYLRPILVKHWKDKDPDMMILGPMPPGVASKMSYIDHMKSSKYCLCPKGYEVNSPRVVEAIFYECVPVIISDNFVPPFFEMLNWDAFSLIIAEKDIPKLRDILVSIPEKKYLEMQLAVRKVQKHFLWHMKPVKYDLFYMTLHSIWYNRVFQIKSR